MNIINELSKIDKTTQIIKNVEQYLREAVEPFIGEPNSQFNQAIIRDRIETITKQYENVGFDFDGDGVTSYIEIKIDMT